MDSPDVIGADLAPMPPARCSKRGCVNEARALHPCPYASEINDDSESLCDCCETHTQECADDI
jgi:hypothetical protein